MNLSINRMHQEMLFGSIPIWIFRDRKMLYRYSNFFLKPTSRDRTSQLFSMENFYDCLHAQVSVCIIWCLCRIIFNIESAHPCGNLYANIQIESMCVFSKSILVV